MPLWLDHAFLRAADALFSLDRRRPTATQLAAVRVVSHRGEHDNRAVHENTVAAFEPLRGSGVFGIEFDVRWTADRVPVVFHDADLRRLFAARDRLCDLTWAQLHAGWPAVPRLDDFVRRFTGEFHLLVELKHEPYPEPDLQDRRLAEALAPALQARRCHVLSLRPDMFRQLPSLPASQTLGIARLNAGAISAESLSARRGGFACHFTALRSAHLRAHRAAGQVVGSGFPSSRALLYREAARGVDWIFTDRPRQLERWRREGPPEPRPGNPAPPD